MKLLIAFPPSWSVTHQPDGRACAIVPDHEGPPDLVIAVSSVEPAAGPLDANTVRRFVGDGMPAKTSLHVQDVGQTRSAAGRPVSMVRAGVHDASGALVEQRLAAIYDLGHYVATVLVVGTDATRWNTVVRSLDQVVLGAVIDWAAPPASLAEMLTSIV